ncbi:hypothetical protein HYC85_010452, partial [Camellia sinensis]
VLVILILIEIGLSGDEAYGETKILDGGEVQGQFGIPIDSINQFENPLVLVILILIEIGLGGEEAHAETKILDSGEVQGLIPRILIMMKIQKDLLCCCLNLTLLYLSLPIFNLISLAATSNDYISSDKFLLNCGSSESSSFNGKDWTGDVGSSYLPSDYNTTSSLSNSIASNPSVPKIPYLSARIFHSQFSYTFPVTPGNKFIRLYFYSAPYYDSSLNPSDACFSVVIAGGFTLLDNFRPSATAYALKSDYFSKDFSINIKEKKLSITFIPSLMASSALAFVNGIEIFSLPLNLYIPKGNASIRFIGQKDPFFNLDETAFEILYRVNVQHEWESFC